MPAGITYKGLLDPKECWKDWNVNLGTLGAVRKKYEEQGRLNFRTGKPPTLSAIQKAAFAWAVENQEEARKDLERAWNEMGLVMTDEDWKKFLVKAGHMVFYQRPRKWEKFIARNGLQQYL